MKSRHFHLIFRPSSTTVRSTLFLALICSSRSISSCSWRITSSSNSSWSNTSAPSWESSSAPSWSLASSSSSWGSFSTSMARRCSAIFFVNLLRAPSTAHQFPPNFPTSHRRQRVLPQFRYQDNGLPVVSGKFGSNKRWKYVSLHSTCNRTQQISICHYWH